jgi:hypothetical protein
MSEPATHPVPLADDVRRLVALAWGLLSLPVPGVDEVEPEDEAQANGRKAYNVGVFTLVPIQMEIEIPSIVAPERRDVVDGWRIDVVVGGGDPFDASDVNEVCEVRFLPAAVQKILLMEVEEALANRMSDALEFEAMQGEKLYVEDGWTGTPGPDENRYGLIENE